MRWSNVEKWPEYDDSLEWAKLEGPFEVGSKISMQPKGLMKATAKLVEVNPQTSFTSESKIPFGVLRFAHSLHMLGDGKTEFVHTVTVTGPFTSLFRKLFINEMTKHLPEMMQKLAKVAERGSRS